MARFATMTQSSKRDFFFSGDSSLILSTTGCTLDCFSWSINAVKSLSDASRAF